MFVYNVKLSKGTVIKVAVIAVVLIAFIFLGFKFITGRNKVSDSIKTPDLVNIDTNNYTNVLKEVHDNMQPYIGQKIKFVGYVYRVSDIGKDEFVLARDMLIGSNSQSVVVGFLCKYQNANNFKEGVWVEVTGTIEKGNYHGDIPIIEVEKMTQTAMPKDALVYPPEDAYLPTSAIL